MLVTSRSYNTGKFVNVYNIDVWSKWYFKTWGVSSICLKYEKVIPVSTSFFHILVINDVIKICKCSMVEFHFEKWDFNELRTRSLGFACNCWLNVMACLYGNTLLSKSEGFKSKIGVFLHTVLALAMLISMDIFTKISFFLSK
jgi:hypothetical protein